MNEGVKYYIGIDEGGYDKNTYAVCVVREDGVVESLSKTHNKESFRKEVERLAKHYNITPNQILREQD